MIRVLVLMLLLRTSDQLNNNLGQTPQMGKDFYRFESVVVIDPCRMEQLEPFCVQHH